ncbi:helicase C-terminal domain-containing protein [Ferrimicrobium sp.]|uniref:helicase C-terminal domain-containing protein n=1 Tax=Ferrimicrobium sp. TaxID=2926050 RepID=UPI0026110274|nr:helicase C-terminal domain-containing protein [Ferrimicrobium sp.]
MATKPKRRVLAHGRPGIKAKITQLDSCIFAHTQLAFEDYLSNRRDSGCLMTFDFKKLTPGSAIADITDPATLFDALPNKAKGYGYLRAVQKTILDGWYRRRDERDLVIKTNTGGGKTIAGLLILQACIHEKVVPALYLAPDLHLQDQVIAEASKLGLRTVSDPKDSKFLSGDAICVTTMQVLINGKTRFGLAGASGRPPLPVGAVIVDDAHAALLLTEEKTYLQIPSEHEAYDELLTMFEDELRKQSPSALLEIQERDPSAKTLRIPFWAWYDRHEDVFRSLHPYRFSNDFEWSWPLIHDELQWCQAVINSKAIEITPLCPPIEKIPSFSGAKRRIYLTATLADDSVLVTHFGANPESVATSIVPDSAGDLGDRLILAPEDLNKAISFSDVRAMTYALANDHNVVVLTPSHERATRWSAEPGAIVSKAADISEKVKQLKTGHVGLVVIVNRYDGIDLPDAACRVLVIDGLPHAYSGTERREEVALRNSDAMVTRQLQRLEQGMGRGVRSRDDRCVVLLLDSRLIQLVSRADIAERLSPATRAQLVVSRRVAGELEGADIAKLQRVITQVIAGDEGFRELSRTALVGVSYGPALLSPSAVFLRRAYEAAVGGRTVEACQLAGKAVDVASNSGDERLAGWIGETFATYLHAVDRVRAQKALNTAGKRNPAVLKPIQGLSYQHVTAANQQSQLASSNLVNHFTTGDQLLLGIHAILADLVWDKERTDATEDALDQLAGFLGLASQRPERDYGYGSDVLWALNATSFAVIEAKSGATGDLIWKKDINQLAGSVNWCKTTYVNATNIVPVLMHQSTLVERTGTPPPGTRVLNQQKVEELKKAILVYATALAQREAYRDSGLVQEQLTSNKLLGTDLVSAYTVAARSQR